jgi:hypothetical protein
MDEVLASTPPCAMPSLISPTRVFARVHPVEPTRLGERFEAAGQAG